MSNIVPSPTRRRRTRVQWQRVLAEVRAPGGQAQSRWPGMLVAGPADGVVGEHG